MIIEKHNLIAEYPELKERLHDLKMGDEHFSRMFDDYNELEKAIIRIEEGIETSSDQYLEELKLKRVNLKDDLVARLKS